MLHRIAALATLLFILSVLATSDAIAAAQRTFVASTGSDANPCSLALPCRSFNAAIAQTSAGGELVILDTAGYGPMTIAQSIKVIGPTGVYGGISVVGGASGITTGVVINAGVDDAITLRGLDISGVPGAAPLPSIGIDIQSAGMVHIEKSSIGNFAQDTGACIRVNVANYTEVFINDSFVRQCRTGIYANGSIIASFRPSVIVDNTRIEGGNTSGPNQTGVWMQGYMDVSLRNSIVSRFVTAVQFDSLLASSTSHFEIINSEVNRNTTVLQFLNTTANASGHIAIIGSQIMGTTNGMTLSNTAVGGNVALQIVDSNVSYSSNNALTLSNSAPDPQARMRVDIVNSQIGTVTGTAVGLSATNGCELVLNMRDSTLSGAATLLQTSGTSSPLNVSLIRSNFTHATTAIDHGQGIIELDGTHVNYNANDFVNNGSGTIISLKNNFVYNNADAPGPTFITPSTILPE